MIKENQNFEDYFKLNKEKKFTIILGSGFHKINKTCSILNNWDLLLKTLDEEYKSKGNYLLDFEQIILSENSSLQASKIEQQKLSKVADELQKVQDNLNAKTLCDYPIEIFNPDFVSDIIILNFDEVAEKICTDILNCKISTLNYIEIDNKLKKNTKIHQTTRFKNVVFPNKSIIRFWHPHGSISEPLDMILGARSYAIHLANVEKLRKYSKSQEKHNNSKTWYDQLTKQPVLILGASISTSEWDIWSAFVNRERNFQKSEHKKYREPIYQMRNEKYLNEINSEWFQPLFSEKYTFEKQWIKLSKLISK